MTDFQKPPAGIKKMNKSVNVFLSSVVLLASSGALVHAASPGAYLGAGAGYSALEPASDAEMLDEGGLGGRLFLGYNFNHYFGVESNYSTFFKTRYVLNDYQNIAIDYKLNALSLVAKGYLPLSQDDPFNLYGSFGVAQVYADIDAKVNLDTVLSDSDSGLVPTIGLGASYDINQRITASLECSVFGKKHADYSHFGIQSSALATFNLAYKF